MPYQQDSPSPSMHWNVMGSAVSSRGATLVFILFTYLLIVRALRYRRMKKLEHSFGYGTRKPLGEMTLDDAAAILLELSEMEFPFSFLNSTQFALFRVRDDSFPHGPPLG
ncbi:hypothetical protein EPUS_08933 [Endocarpon pusillum Z07020]|uniref:Uncharacterized protein n=1 Tax=Endocarpon pusillum (strain Z07020 / HMAS-L-300199) TaxID=1263415 RepID=U1GGB5_ENDPU|nr:uncharacterized protein EPUS_08933 [Endocarpon pusillum Z07020]ERF71138.1 hypothetical protein EPUS_08933 [Endocarpon pusillum Z07020]